MEAKTNSVAVGGQGLAAPDQLFTRRPSRDRVLVAFVGRHGVVEIAHVMAALGVGRTAAYRRVAACVQRGLLERLALLREEPSLIRASREGLRYAGLGGLPVAVVSPGAVEHWLRCASTALALAAEFGAEPVISERELAFAEQVEGRPLASAKLGKLPGGGPRLHRPDLVIWPAAGASDAVADSRAQGGLGVGASAGSSGREAEQLPIAVEVELSPKAPRRLAAIIRAWRRASWVEEVRYYCAPGATHRGVERAVAAMHAGERVHIYEAAPR